MLTSSHLLLLHHYKTPPPVLTGYFNGNMIVLVIGPSLRSENLSSSRHRFYNVLETFCQESGTCCHDCIICPLVTQEAIELVGMLEPVFVTWHIMMLGEDIIRWIN